ncbi:hypothetical protein Esti_006777 [Eimeria stiedai]
MLLLLLLQLMYCVLHLAPHHYHHFHAPCDFSQTIRRHMHGECLPVFRSFLAKFNDIFNVQERVVLSGSWIGGCLHLAAVAACNDLRTNRDRVVLRHLGGDIDIRTFRDKPLQFDVGSHVGEFRLGSTIVLVFEAPRDFEFCVKPGQRILAGSRLGGVGPEQAAATAAAYTGEDEDAAAAATAAAAAATAAAARRDSFFCLPVCALDKPLFVHVVLK